MVKIDSLLVALVLLAASVVPFSTTRAAAPSQATPAVEIAQATGSGESQDSYDQVQNTGRTEDFIVSKTMITWRDLVPFLNETQEGDLETQEGDLYQPEITPCITRSSKGGESGNEWIYEINPDHPEYASEPAVCSINLARRYCNYVNTISQSTNPEATYHLLDTTQYQQWNAAFPQSGEVLHAEDPCEWIENDVVGSEHLPQVLHHGSAPQLLPSEDTCVAGFRLTVNKSVFQNNATPSSREEASQNMSSKKNVPDQSPLLGETNGDVIKDKPKFWTGQRIAVAGLFLASCSVGCEVFFVYEPFEEGFRAVLYKFTQQAVLGLEARIMNDKANK